MATLVAIGYPDETTADQARLTTISLEHEVIEAPQVVSISRDQQGRYHVTASHEGSATVAVAAWGGFMGILFGGVLFAFPFVGLAVGAGLGALAGHFSEKGIDKEFQQQVRDMVKPGTSALFMIIDEVDPDRATAALKQYGGTVIRTTLSEEDKAKLQEALTPREAGDATG